MPSEPAGSDEGFEADFALQSSYISTSFDTVLRVYPRQKNMSFVDTDFSVNRAPPGSHVSAIINNSRERSSVSCILRLSLH